MANCVSMMTEIVEKSLEPLAYSKVCVHACYFGILYFNLSKSLTSIN